mmetsp:Transcript_68/g.120  ORF Transcript_68/g.120 Transcript_68/m.120 type:complete len:351 (+) Transcript_68:243-1295(+)
MLLLRCVALFGLVDFHVPLVIRLVSLQGGSPVQSPFGGHLFQRLENARHHALEAAKVNDGPVLEPPKELGSLLLQQVLDIESSARGIGHFPRNRIVDAQTASICIWRLPPEHGVEFRLVQERSGGRHPQNQPGPSLEHVVGGRVLDEHAVQKAAKGSNPRSRRHHDDILGGILRKDHRLADWTGDLDGGASGGVAQKTGADAGLGGIGNASFGIVVLGPTDAEADRGSVQQISVSCRGNAVQSGFVGLSLGVHTGRNDAERLSLDVAESFGQLQNDVLNVSRCVFRDQSGASQNGGLHGSLGSRKERGNDRIADIFQPALGGVQKFWNGGSHHGLRDFGVAASRRARAHS